MEIDKNIYKYIILCVQINDYWINTNCTSITYFLAPPQFRENNIRLNVKKGDNANLICEAFGDDPMDIDWYEEQGVNIKQGQDSRSELHAEYDIWYVFLLHK